MIKLLSVAIFAGLFFALKADSVLDSPVLEECWTPWFDRDNPSGTGDWELLATLQNEKPGKICDNPAAIEVQTVGGTNAAETGDVFFRNDPNRGFVCRNEDQNDGSCEDYRVRFLCPLPYCDQTVCLTKWFDSNNEGGRGDFETLLRLNRLNPGKICDKPVAIEAQTLTGLSVAAAGEVIFKSDTTRGFICRNKDQNDGSCEDYRVRFTCPPSYCDEKVCWTKWFDRDNATGTGDNESLDKLKEEHPGEICETPLRIEVVTIDTNSTPTSTGDIIFKSSPTEGFVCRTEDQECGLCRDYKVRFECPC